MAPQARVPLLPANGPKSTCSAVACRWPHKHVFRRRSPLFRRRRPPLRARMPSRSGGVLAPRRFRTSYAEWTQLGIFLRKMAAKGLKRRTYRPNCNRSCSDASKLQQKSAGAAGGGGEMGGWRRLSARQAGSRESGGHAKRPPVGGRARGRRACETTARGGFARGGRLARGGQMCERRRRAGRCERRVSYTANGDPVGPPSRKGADVVRRSAGARALARRWRSGASGCWPTAPFQALP